MTERDRRYEPAEKLFVCPTCGRYVKACAERVEDSGKVMNEYWCPRCRMTVRTTLGG